MTVTDFDADQAIQPMKRAAQGRYSTGDKVLVGAGVLLAAMAAFFPWYVFLNPEKFSVPREIARLSGSLIVTKGKRSPTLRTSSIVVRPMRSSLK